MRISDWSSDVCSSDLRMHRGAPTFAAERRSARELVERLGASRASSEIARHADALHVVPPNERRDVVHDDDGSDLGPNTVACLGHGFRHTEPNLARSEEHTSELQSLMRTSYAVFCLKT